MKDVGKAGGMEGNIVVEVTEEREKDSEDKGAGDGRADARLPTGTWPCQVNSPSTSTWFLFKFVDGFQSSFASSAGYL